MIVDADPTAGTVTVRLSTPTLLLRGAAAVALGIGAPLLARTWAPALLVPALLVTAAAAAWTIAGLARTVVLDDHGIALTATRRRTRRVPWDRVEAITVDAGRVLVATVDGTAVHGPRCDPDALAEACRDAALLGLVGERR